MNKILNKFYLYRALATVVHRLFVRLDPKIEMRRIYKKIMNKRLNLDNPKNLIEKIYWLQLNSDTSLWTECADKYRMRDYVTRCGLIEYLPKLYAKWDSADEIDFTALPDCFMMKTNNGCAQCMLVDKSKGYDLDRIRKQFSDWLSISYGYAGAQLHYTRITPCVIAEELLVSSDEDKLISPRSLIDYKVYCFGGKPECIWVAYNRHDGAYVNMDLFDTEWGSLSCFLKNTKVDSYCPGTIIPKPKCLDEMLCLASKLSQPFKEVRVDFYVINNRPVIGELTFTTGYGYFTDEYYDYLGSKIDLKG